MEKRINVKVRAVGKADKTDKQFAGIPFGEISAEQARSLGELSGGLSYYDGPGGERWLHYDIDRRIAIEYLDVNWHYGAEEDKISYTLMSIEDALKTLHSDCRTYKHDERINAQLEACISEIENALKTAQ